MSRQPELTQAFSSLPTFPQLPQVPGTAAYTALRKASLDMLALPFDLARASYVNAVRAGLIERSMLASREFERRVSAMETLALGPLTRKV